MVLPGPASRAAQRRVVAATFAGLAAALVLGVYLPSFIPGLGDAASLAVYVGASLGVVAFALVKTHRIPLRAVPAELGMDRSAVVGLSWAFVVTLPMVLGFLLARQGVFFEEGALDVVTRRPWAVLAAWAGAGLVEETLFRGYFFRQLVLRAGWPTHRGILVCGAIFGLLHVPAAWGRPPGEIVGAALVTAVGGAGFCWFLKEWRWNLWFVIGWHAFVNLWWTLGQGGDSAVGGSLSNVLRLGVVALTVVLTVNRHRLPQRWLGSHEEPRAATDTER